MFMIVYYYTIAFPRIQEEIEIIMGTRGEGLAPPGSPSADGVSRNPFGKGEWVVLIRKFNLSL
jgi:hypothetical protein